MKRIPFVLGALLWLVMTSSFRGENLVRSVLPVNDQPRHRLQVLLVTDTPLAQDAATLQAQMAEHANVSYVQLTNGITETLGTMEGWLSQRRWDVIFCSFSAADLQAPVSDNAQRRKDLRAMFQRLRAACPAVVWGSAPGSGFTRFNDVGRALATEEGVTICDVAALFVAVGPQRGVSERTKLIAQDILQAVTDRGSAPADLDRFVSRDPGVLLNPTGALDVPANLELLPSEKGLIYRAQEGGWQFNLHSYIARFENKFWAVWSSGRVDEDSSSQFIRFATSEDGLQWSEADVLAPDPDGESGLWRWMASGLYVRDGRLYCLGTLNRGMLPSGEIWADARLVRFVWERDRWKEDKVVAEDCVWYFPPLDVEGREFVVWRNSFAHFATALFDEQLQKWNVTRIPGPFPAYRLSETSHYVAKDGSVHLIIRDQGGTGRMYRSVSYNAGGTWTVPVQSNYPDATSKNFAARLENGWYFLINNPTPHGPHRRATLAISFSEDGWSFSKPKALLRDAPPLRYKGHAKGSQSYQYAHAIEHDGKLWVIYSTNKEDIEVAAYRVEDLLR